MDDNDSQVVCKNNIDTLHTRAYCESRRARITSQLVQLCVPATKQKKQLLLLFTVLVLVFFTPPYLKRLHGIVSGRIDDDDMHLHSNNDGITNTNTKNLSSECTIVSGPTDRPAIVMLTDGSSKVSKFQNQSIDEKAAYARHHNYTLICCTGTSLSSLDEYRSATWKKLKLIYRVLDETSHDTILWLDVDTIIWNRRMTIEHFSPSSSSSSSKSKSISAQLDLHRSMESKYFNAGILIIHKTDWIMHVLREAYRQWQIALFQGIFYFDADQDALNLVMARYDTSSTRRNRSANTGASGNAGGGDLLKTHLDLKRYGQLWTLSKDHRRYNPFVLHFPNCLKGRCAPEYLKLYHQAMNDKKK